MAGHFAVLVGIYNDSIVLTKRAKELRAFHGQICLPGGAYDPTDNDYTMTAIREFYEEVNFEGEVNPFFCFTPEFSPVAKSNIYPILARLNGKINGFNHQEVEKIFYLKLSDLVDNLFKINPNIVRTFHNWCFDYDGEFVWGLTAQILKNLCCYKEVLL